MVCLNENAPLRTNENFRNRIQSDHHRGCSPFEKLSVDMVQQFPLDYMNLVCLSVTKLIITLWLKHTPKHSATESEKLSKAFTDLNHCVPSEFNRKTQPIMKMKRWKAVTFRLFLLYAGLSLISRVVPFDVMKMIAKIIVYMHVNCCFILFRS